MTYTVGYIVGSLSLKSINRKLALALSRLAPPELRLTEIPIGELPLYSHDHDPSYPAVALEFKDAIKASDALLFVTPEYNRLGRAEERHRLGDPALWIQRVERQAVRDHRSLTPARSPPRSHSSTSRPSCPSPTPRCWGSPRPTSSSARD